MGRRHRSYHLLSTHRLLLRIPASDWKAGHQRRQLPGYRGRWVPNHDAEGVELESGRHPQGTRSKTRFRVPCQFSRAALKRPGVRFTDSMQYYWLIVGILAVWRVSCLLNSEAGPWDAFKRMRRRFAGSVFGDLVNCFYCLSVWVSVPFAFVLNDTWKGRLLLWPALSA